MARKLKRVVLWGSCDTGKPRVRILLEGLRRCGVEVIECRTDIWTGVEDKSRIRGPLAWARFLARIALSYPRLAARYLRLPSHDWVLLGYPAIPDIVVIRLLAWLRRVPVAMDWFLSAYDTVVLDRGLVAQVNPLAWLLWAVEAITVRLADLVFMDTRTHATRMERLFRLPQGRCKSVWVGVETAEFARSPMPGGDRLATAERPLRVLFYGQFIPLHGVPVIVEAARLLEHAPIEWLVIGRGQEAAKVRRLIEQHPLPRLTWLEWVSYSELLRHIEHSDVCLGIFGTSEKAASVIPNKVFQALAAGRPVITRDSDAIRELLPLVPDSLRLTPAGDGHALAEALARVPRPPSPEEHERLLQSIGEAGIGQQLVTLMTCQER